MPYFFPHFINIKHFNLVNKQKAPFSTTETITTESPCITWYRCDPTQTLTLSILGKIFNRLILKYFSYLSQKIGIDISCKLSPEEIICMKGQSLFSGKNLTKKKFKMSSAEVFTQHAEQ